MDWGGLFLVTGSLSGLVFALNNGNTVYPWISVNVMLPLFCGIFGLVLFGIYEVRIAGPGAMLSKQLFSDRTAVSGYIVTIIHAMICWAVVYYFFLYVSLLQR